jgi:hypothetical protein
MFPQESHQPVHRFYNRLHLGRESYATKQKRCNQFRENKLHLVGFVDYHPVFAPFCSSHGHLLEAKAPNRSSTFVPENNSWRAAYYSDKKRVAPGCTSFGAGLILPPADATQLWQP